MHDGLMGQAGTRLPTPASSVYQTYQQASSSAYSRYFYDPNVQVGSIPGTGIASTWRNKNSIAAQSPDLYEPGGVTIATAGTPTVDVLPGRLTIGGTIAATTSAFSTDIAPYAGTSLDIPATVYYATETSVAYTGISLTPSITAQSATGGTVTGLTFTPSAGGIPLTSMVGLDLNMQHSFETVTTLTGVDVNCSETFGTATNSYCYIGAVTNSSSTITNGTILYAATNGATNKWSLQLGDFQSQHIGKLGLGGAAVTTAPTYALDIMGTAQDRGVIAIAESSATPTDPSSSNQAVIYVRGDNLIVGFNDGGTMRYKYLTLSGTSVTWTHTTTAPT